MRAIKLSLKVFVMFALAGQFGIPVLNAQQPGVKRVELQRADLSIAVATVVAPSGVIGQKNHDIRPSRFVGREARTRNGRDGLQKQGEGGDEHQSKTFWKLDGAL